MFGQNRNQPTVVNMGMGEKNGIAAGKTHRRRPVFFSNGLRALKKAAINKDSIVTGVDSKSTSSHGSCGSNKLKLQLNALENVFVFEELAAFSNDLVFSQFCVHRFVALHVRKKSGAVFLQIICKMLSANSRSGKKPFF